MSEKRVKSNDWIISLISLIIFCVVNSVLIYFLVKKTIDVNSDIKKLGRWNLLSSVILTKTVESIIYMLSAVILKGSNSFNISSSPKREKMIEYFKLSIDELTKSNEELLKGNDYVSGLYGFDNETQLIKQQRDAEDAKAQSENLLFQILPSGEKDISFTVQSASIIFLDVVKFSEYTYNLTPREIMRSLSTLFAEFDSCAKKYELLTKIKLIGDIYMSAAGLFYDENVSPKDHAEQILTVGLDRLNELEEVNIKLNANLQLRIGINCGEPILAGVLGTDKPVFDIIGDPINVASRLPGKVQISKSTYDLVFECNFFFEERGGVFLKGKEKLLLILCH